MFSFLFLGSCARQNQLRKGLFGLGVKALSPATETDVAAEHDAVGCAAPT